jgi:2-polyprenyl-3-methyl-5-hydroxy-6-metoxy-1,4-benzoquinol methylase
MDSFEAVERAAAHYYHSQQQLGIDNRTKALVMERLVPYLKGPDVLELGFVDGMFTDRLLSEGFCVDCVDGAARHVEYGLRKYAGNSRVRFHHALFQEYTPDGLYDTVVAGDMIRYVADAHAFLARVAGWLRPGGRLLLTVPNSRSMHRRLGALMGTEKPPEQANQRDLEVGNLRSYDRYELFDLLRRSGYRVAELHGAFLKPLSSEQMADFSDSLLRALDLLGTELEDYCWFMYAVAFPLGDPRSD